MFKSTDKKYFIALLLALFPITGTLGIQWFIIKRNKIGIIWLLIFISTMGHAILKSYTCKGDLYYCIGDGLVPYFIFIIFYIVSVFSMLPVVIAYLGTSEKTRVITKNQLLFSSTTTIVSTVGFVAFLIALLRFGLGFLYVHLSTVPEVIFSPAGFICMFSLLLILCNCITLFLKRNFNKSFLNYPLIVFFAALGNTLLAIFSVWQLSLIFPWLF